jgi:hypothetical protein
VIVILSLSQQHHAAQGYNVFFLGPRVGQHPSLEDLLHPFLPELLLRKKRVGSFQIFIAARWAGPGISHILQLILFLHVPFSPSLHSAKINNESPWEGDTIPTNFSSRDIPIEIKKLGQKLSLKNVQK